MKDYLIVVDMQKDFVDGALGTKEAVAIVPAVVERVKRVKKLENAYYSRGTRIERSIWIRRRAGICR